MIKLYCYKLQASNNGNDWVTMAKSYTFKRRHVNRLLKKYNKKPSKEKYLYWRISETYKTNEEDQDG